MKCECHCRCHPEGRFFGMIGSQDQHAFPLTVVPIESLLEGALVLEAGRSLLEDPVETCVVPSCLGSWMRSCQTRDLFRIDREHHMGQASSHTDSDLVYLSTRSLDVLSTRQCPSRRGQWPSPTDHGRLKGRLGRHAGRSRFQSSYFVRERSNGDLSD